MLPGRGRRPAASGQPSKGTLRFRDAGLERSFLDHYFETVYVLIRVAHALGIVMWMLGGLVVRRFLVEERSFDLVARYAVLIPLLLCIGPPSATWRSGGRCRRRARGALAQTYSCTSARSMMDMKVRYSTIFRSSKIRSSRATLKCSIEGPQR